MRGTINVHNSCCVEPPGPGTVERLLRKRKQGKHNYKSDYEKKPPGLQASSGSGRRGWQGHLRPGKIPILTGGLGVRRMIEQLRSRPADAVLESESEPWTRDGSRGRCNQKIPVE